MIIDIYIFLKNLILSRNLKYKYNKFLTYLLTFEVKINFVDKSGSAEYSTLFLIKIIDSTTILWGKQVKNWKNCDYLSFFSEYILNEIINIFALNRLILFCKLKYLVLKASSWIKMALKFLKHLKIFWGMTSPKWLNPINWMLSKILKDK